MSYSRPALRSGICPFATYPGQQAVALLQTLSSSSFARRCYRRSYHPTQRGLYGKPTHEHVDSTHCAPNAASRSPSSTCRYSGRGDSTSGTTWASNPSDSPDSRSASESPVSHIWRYPQVFPAPEAAARCATTLLLAVGMVLTATLGSPVETAAAAAASVAIGFPLSPTLAGPALRSLQQRVAPEPEAAAPTGASPNNDAALSTTPTVPAIRFTGPEVLEKLPPLPTEFPPLPELELPSYTTAKLRNGLRVFLLRDDEVPLVRATLIMRGGQYGSPPDKVGLASLTAYVQRAGGSEAHPASSLDSRLEELAASIEFGAGPQAISADLQCLAEDADEVISLMAEVVRKPVLPADKLALYKAQVLNALEHQNDSPAAIGRRKITKLLYGADSIYARTPIPEGISSISPADLRSYMDRWERPDGAVLGVVGAFEPPKMLVLVEREFGDWAPAAGQPDGAPAVPRGLPPAVPSLLGASADARLPTAFAAATAGQAEAPAQLETSPSSASLSSPVAAASLASLAGSSNVAVPLDRRPGVYLVDRPGLTQAYVLTAEPGISLSDPDMFALDVLSGVFNSFGGQLFDTLRSREGLAYSVSGGWDSPPDHPGLFVAGGQTSSPGQFLRSLRQLLAKAAAEAPTEEELEAAKAETLNSFAFNFASTSNQLQRILVYDLLGLPQDFLFQYIKGIEGVDRKDVSRAAGAHLHPESQAVVVVGDREVAQPSLETAGFDVYPMRLDD